MTGPGLRRVATGRGAIGGAVALALLVLAVRAQAGDPEAAARVPASPWARPGGTTSPMLLPVSQTAPRMGPTFWMTLEGGRNYRFETRSLAPRTDTVLTLFEGCSGPVAQNDDIEPLPGERIKEPRASRIEYVPVRRGPFAIMITARPGSMEGMCDLYVDGKPYARRIEYGKPYHPELRRRLPLPEPARPAPPLPEQPLYELPRPEQMPARR